jgi:hypothetical protein
MQIKCQSANPAKLDKSLYAGIIYAGGVDNSATETKTLAERVVPESQRKIEGGG